jgi:hypothetical protein
MASIEFKTFTIDPVQGSDQYSVQVGYVVSGSNFDRSVISSGTTLQVMARMTTFRKYLRTRRSSLSIRRTSPARSSSFYLAVPWMKIAESPFLKRTRFERG